MATVIRSKATMQPGGRVEIVDPNLKEGEAVEVIVTVPEAKMIRRRPPGMGLLEWLDSLPPGPRSADTWEELDRLFQEERNSWDR